MRPLLPATSASRTDNDDKGLVVFTGDVGTQTSLWGLNWEIQTPPTAGARHSRGGRGGGADTLCSALLSSPAEGNTACDCFTLKWTNLWRGKYSGPPRDLGVMSLYEVPSSLSLATTLFAIECKCTCGCHELLYCFDVCGPRSVGIMNLYQQVLNY